MWWFWLFSLLFLTSTLAEKEISDIFTLLEGTGTCDDTLMNNFLTDARALVKALDDALGAIENEPSGQDGTVARSLLHSWLGIPVDEEGLFMIKTDIKGDELDFEDQYERVSAISNQLQGFLKGSGLIAPETPPEMICNGKGFRKFDWTDSILIWNSAAQEYEDWLVDEDDVQISQAYDGYDGADPYLLENNHKYYIARDDLSENDICDGLLEEGYLGHTFSGQASSTRTIMAQVVTMDGTSPLVVMCPDGLKAGTLQGLKDKRGKRTVGVTEITEINLEVTGPTTLFHELIHLTSYWTETTSGDFERSADYVVDYTYNPGECLSMAYQGVEIDVTNDETEKVETKYFSPQDASLNAESYTLFALAYWYYLNTDQTFYYGILGDWNAGHDSDEA